MASRHEKYMILFSAKLLRPVATGKPGSWTFLILPKSASAKLPSRGMATVEGTINGALFRATLEPDGQRSHWLKVDRKICEAAGANPGDIVTLGVGTVVLTETLRVSGGVTLEGAGAQRTILDARGQAVAISVDGSAPGQPSQVRGMPCRW